MITAPSSEEALSRSRNMDARAEALIPAAVADADTVMVHMLVVGKALARKYPNDPKRRERATAMFHTYLDLIIEEELNNIKGKSGQ